MFVRRDLAPFSKRSRRAVISRRWATPALIGALVQMGVVSGHRQHRSDRGPADLRSGHAARSRARRRRDPLALALASKHFRLLLRDALRVQLADRRRIGEVGGMTTGEIDRDKWLWTLPAARSKNKKPRVTPLIGVARTIIEARIEAAEDDILFPSARGSALTSVSVGSALHRRRSDCRSRCSKSHDLRRTAASLMYELGIAKDIIGAIIGHGSDEDDRSCAHAAPALSQIRFDRAQDAALEN